jgi:hypothetical protein
MNNFTNNIKPLDQQPKLFDKYQWINQGKEVIPGGDLQDLRNFRALRIPKNIVSQIVAHKDYISLCYYLALKPLFISGSIHKLGDQAIYKRLAAFFNISESGMRSHLNKLESLNLIRYEKNNLILSGYKTFCRLFICGEHQYKHKFYFYNNIDIKTFIKTVAYAEKKKQIDYTILEKLSYLSIKLPDWEFNKGKTAHLSDTLRQYNIDKDQTDPKRFAANLKKAKSYVSKNLDKFKNQYELIFEEQIKSRLDNKQSDTGNFYELWREYLDPISTLSCKGLANLLNRKSKSTGYYQALKMFNSDFINITRRYVFSDSDTTFWDIKRGLAPGTCINKFPKKIKQFSSERRDKYLINLPNILKPCFNLNNC